MSENKPRHTIVDLYDVLFETLEDLRAKKITTFQANAVVNVAQTIVNTGRLECMMIDTIGTNGTGFLPDDKSPPKTDRLRLVHRTSERSRPLAQ